MRHSLVLAAALVFAAALYSAKIFAHSGGTSYLDIQRVEGRWLGRWDISLRDLDFALGLDVDGDTQVTWGELLDQRERLAVDVMPDISFSSGAYPCRPMLTGVEVANRADGKYAALALDLGCPADGPTLEVSYRFFFEFDRYHVALLRLRDGDRQAATVLSHRQREYRENLSSKSDWTRRLSRYARQGAIHMLGGLDHLLFLVVLLLPCALHFERGRWVACQDPRSALPALVKTVTAFTAAHAVTLSLAATGTVAAPMALIEVGIALTVMLAAMNNIWPRMYQWQTLAAFLVGLIHGFGFANALGELGLPDDDLAAALFGFNLGIELAQLGLVLGLFPILFAVRRSKAFHRVFLPGASALVVACAAWWLVERFDSLASPMV